MGAAYVRFLLLPTPYRLVRSRPNSIPPGGSGQALPHAFSTRQAKGSTLGVHSLPCRSGKMDQGMTDGSRQTNGPPSDSGNGLVVIRRLHRMVRRGYRPWLGYDVTSGADRDIHLRRRDNTASIGPDGKVSFTAPIRIPPTRAARPGLPGSGLLVIAGEDEALFDAVFPANTPPNRRNLVRRLYEIGVGAW